MWSSILKYTLKLWGYGFLSVVVLVWVSLNLVLITKEGVTEYFHYHEVIHGGTFYALLFGLIGSLPAFLTVVLCLFLFFTRSSSFKKNAALGIVLGFILIEHGIMFNWLLNDDGPPGATSPIFWTSLGSYLIASVFWIRRLSTP